MSDFKRGAFNYIAYYLRSGQYLPGSHRTETILTYHRAEKSRKLRRVELSSTLYSSMLSRCIVLDSLGYFGLLMLAY
jgi:hypothetical protein